MPQETTKTREVAVQAEDFSRLSMPIETMSFRNSKNVKMTKITHQKTSSEEGISFPPRSSILSPETTHVLQKAEELIENAQSQIAEINHNILFHKENLEM